MKLYNTQTRSLEEFTPQNGEVTLYVCGITPYDTTHLGHAFTYTSYDQLVRYLELKGIRVRYAQNVTDIDDDILKRAKEVGEDWRALGKQWTHHFIDDMIALNVRPPDYYPHATDVIPDIVSAVETLIAKGAAYEKNGSVYFDVQRYPEFGQLSHLAPNEMLPVANERGNRPDDPNKRRPIDFVLWQAQAPGEPAWHSPWGPGRPGWHIECSTMATRFLGNTIDIHGGGMDLCFPHHECEIAQVAPVRRSQLYVRYWMHTAMVGYQGEKMSKSLGNLIMVSDLLKTYSADALRLYLGSHKYRTAWAYEQGDVDAFEEKARLLREAAAGDNGAVGAGSLSWRLADIEREFTTAMEDDLDTPRALQALERLAANIQAATGQADVREAQAALRRFGGVFGLTFGAGQPEERVVSGWNEKKR